MTPRHDYEPVATEPGYLGLAQTLLAKSGPLALLSVGFAVFMCAVVWVRLVNIEKMMTEARTGMASFSATHIEQDRERNNWAAAQTALLRQLCINSAKDEQQRRDCALAEVKR